MKAQLKQIELPEFGMPTVEPQLGPEIFKERIARTRARMQEAGLDALVIYADREHNATMTWLCGYDPRFEESILILLPTGTPVLLVGNEGMGYSELLDIELERVLYQSMSLMGQDRSKSRKLKPILEDAGLKKGMKTGVAGWKYFSAAESDQPQQWIEAPSYMVDELRAICGGTDMVVNASELFMDPENGLRAINEVDQLAQFEFASCHTSQGLRNVMFGLRPGMTEYEAASLMKVSGIPLSCHLMLSTGKRAFHGLPSPSIKVMEQGEPFTNALGMWGALNARAGWLVEDESQLPTKIRDYVDKLVAPYFAAVAEWYENLAIGTECGRLYDVVMKYLSDPFFGVGLNPGHLIHIEEWLHSPFYQGSKVPIKAGMAIQADFIPATGTDYFTTNIEDNLAIMDQSMREEFARKYPEAWQRVQARRTFMQDELNIRLAPEVMPFSNIPAYLPPYLLSPQKAMYISER